MISVNGYYDGNEYVTLEKVPVKENQKVRITILDDFFLPVENTKNVSLLKKYKGLGGKAWKQDAQEYVSSLRSEERKN